MGSLEFLVLLQFIVYTNFEFTQGLVNSVDNLFQFVSAVFDICVIAEAADEQITRRAAGHILSFHASSCLCTFGWVESH